MKKILFLITFSFSLLLFSQESATSLKTYRAERTKIHDIVHTKLKVSFDFAKRQMKGEAWITAKPHFYSVQNISLDAKAMLIHSIKMGSRELEYNYDGNELIINLGNAYARGESFEVYINYTARPEEVKQKGSMAISDAKGLYFIDPDETDPDKPTQIWTQGETESNSCWFPTIDSPNQKSTGELYITVPSKYTTLSNGLLLSKTENEDGTRTDYWKMDQPIAPYLFFMGIGEYSVIEDSWNGKPVNYYVEPEYKDVAQDIFGNTPEMIQFFSDKFGIVYPWDKYSQMVARDYVSGAMENATCTLHSEMAYQKKGQLVDGNTWEDVISHELSHHWFGDLVTTESWSNITVNESFADYCEYLWREYKYGKDHADAHLYDNRNTYLMGQNYDKNLVRFHYSQREDVFDGVSYQKGALILHMLRNDLGDDAFFKGLQHYLKKHEFGTAEAQELRIALEEVSGKDLNPFFNQWYYSNGNPRLHISYEYSDFYNTVTVTVKQADKVFNFPLAIDVYESGKVANHTVQVTEREQEFTFRYNQKPDLVNVNANHILLCEITDKEKTLDNYIFQYNHAPHYVDRKEAIEELAKHQDNDLAFKTLTKALNDSYYGLRILALKSIDLRGKYQKKQAIKAIEVLATSDPKTKVKGVAISILGKLIDPIYKPVFVRGMQSDSYSVKGNATLAMYDLDKTVALEAIKGFDKDTKEFLAVLLTKIYIEENDESQMPFIAKNLLATMFVSNFSQYHKDDFEKTFSWIATSSNKEAIQNLVNDLVKNGKRYKKYGVNHMAIGLLQQLVNEQSKTDNTDKEALILIAKKGMAELLE
jgi:aminopeptidase N